MPLKVCFVWYLLWLLDCLLLMVVFYVCFDFLLHFLLKMFVLVVFFGVQIWNVL